MVASLKILQKLRPLWTLRTRLPTNDVMPQRRNRERLAIPPLMRVMARVLASVTVTLDTLRSLHEHDHKLAAYCATCERLPGRAGVTPLACAARPFPFRFQAIPGASVQSHSGITVSQLRKAKRSKESRLHLLK